MKFNITKYIPENATRQLSRRVLQTKKNSPHIFFAVGIAGVVTSTVLACRATLKLNDRLDEVENRIEDAKDISVREQLSRSQHSALMLSAYSRSAVDITKLYLPSVILMTVSVGALTGSHVQMTRRNSALTATVATLSKTLDDYRERVRKELGVERELDLYHGATTHTITNEDGSTQEIKMVDPTNISGYARIFDETNPRWSKSRDINKTFLMAQQNYMNHLLKSRGHLFLSEVYEALGFQKSQASIVVGWVLDENFGDNYVDFGLFEVGSYRFVNEIEPGVLLDFNVNGVIWDKI